MNCLTDPERKTLFKQLSKILVLASLYILIIEDPRALVIYHIRNKNVKYLIILKIIIKHKMLIFLNEKYFAVQTFSEKSDGIILHVYKSLMFDLIEDSWILIFVLYSSLVKCCFD